MGSFLIIQRAKCAAQCLKRKAGIILVFKVALSQFIKLTILVLVVVPTFARVNASVHPQKTYTPRTSKAGLLPSDAEIRRLLVERVRALSGSEDGIGIVVGVVGPQGRRIISYGHLNKNDPRTLNGDTVFEIASVTKVFTSLLLADMVQRGELRLSDPVATYLPSDIKLPERNSHPITFLDLATHTSGLPFMPALPGFNDVGGTRYTDHDLYQFLASYSLKEDIGLNWEYSNVGYWLLGQALAARAGMDYEKLLRTRILLPLKMTNTSFVPSSTMNAKLAVGHNASLQQAPRISTMPGYAIMPAAGGLLSTVNDLLIIPSIAMGFQRSSLASAIELALKTTRSTPIPDVEQALGWKVIRDGNDRLIFQDGGSFGYASALIWDPTKRIGIAVLSNHIAGVADIARHLLRPNFPLEKPQVKVRTEISLSSEVLDHYTGPYDALGEGVFVIARKGNLLTIHSPADWGLPDLLLHPESTENFFARELPLTVTFQRDSSGHINGMLIYPPRGQKAVRAKRLL